MSDYRKLTRLAATMSAIFLLTGCASVWHPKTPEDPYESYNRQIFVFNRGVDAYVFRPIAKTYDTVTPKVVQNRVTNFFQNVDTISVIANDILQANANWAISDSWRLLINTTVGLVGLWDPATNLGLPVHQQDLGLTFAKWGMRDSPYFIFPFLPPATARDFLGLTLDHTAFSPWTYLRSDRLGFAIRGFDLIETRAQLLGMDKLVDQAFDPYIFVRNFYMQNRQAKINKVLQLDSQSLETRLDTSTSQAQ
jgi:phospholipid-binding lipoprotein MlaA